VAQIHILAFYQRLKKKKKFVLILMIFYLFESIFSTGHKNKLIGIPDTATDPIIQDNGSAVPDPSEIFTDPNTVYQKS
jgi:hypothetical protein